MKSLSPKAQEVLDKALALPWEERLKLLMDLLETLPPSPEREELRVRVQALFDPVKP